MGKTLLGAIIYCLLHINKQAEIEQLKEEVKKLRAREIEDLLEERPFSFLVSEQYVQKVTKSEMAVFKNIAASIDDYTYIN